MCEAMTSFPPIRVRCPLRFRALPEPDRDWCGFCQKRVHNLDLMSESERRALLARGDSICVAYTVKRAATAVAASAGVATALSLSACSSGERSGKASPSSAVVEPLDWTEIRVGQATLPESKAIERRPAPRIDIESFWPNVVEELAESREDP
jgi:hypothetical protein